MKNNILLFFFSIISLTLFSQNKLGKSDDAARIVISSYVPEQIEGLSDITIQSLTNKLDQITTNAGLGGSSSRFIITPSINVLGKEITPTAPPMTALSLNITFFIGDGIDGTKFSSYSIETKGVGNTETKAYISALKNIRVNDPGYNTFIENGKKKIIEYYNSQCDFILKNANSMADRKEYESAIYNLTSIPEVCKECYDKAMDLSVKIYRDKLENECQQNLTRANAAIANDHWDEASELISFYTPDMKCYAEVQKLLNKITDHRCEVSLGKARGAWASKDIETTSLYLSEISADSKCSLDAQKLALEVKIWAKEKDAREWNFELKKQQDNVDIKKLSISAARAIGVAFGKNQPKTVYKYAIIKSWK